MEHGATYEDTMESREKEGLYQFKVDVITTAFCCATYTMGMEELTNFGMKNSLTLPSLANKFFSRLKYENDEPVNKYTDPFMQKFVRNSVEGGRCATFGAILQICSFWWFMRCYFRKK